MTCIKICFSLVFVAVFTSVLTDDCDELLKSCTCKNIKTYLEALAPCTKDGTCLKENDDKKIKTPECEKCRAKIVLAMDDPWCVCLNKQCGMDESTINDSKKKEDAEDAFTSYIFEYCLGAFAEPECKHESHERK